MSNNLETAGVYVKYTRPNNNLKAHLTTAIILHMSDDEASGHLDKIRFIYVGSIDKNMISINVLTYIKGMFFNLDDNNGYDTPHKSYYVGLYKSV